MRKQITMLLVLGVLLSLCACGKNNEEIVEEAPVILVYGTMHLEQEMSTWIAEYNLTHEDCQVEVREYGQDGREEGLLRLNAELVRGNGPDLIDLSDIDVGPYISLGILTDIYPMLENDPELRRESLCPVP